MDGPERKMMDGPEQKIRDVFRDISDRIKYFRRQQGLSLNALAKKAGFTTSYLSQIENMKREPTIGTLVTIAHALGVSVFSFIGGEGLLEEEAPAIVRADERRRVTIPSTVADSLFDSINFRTKDRLMGAYILTSSSEFSEKPRAHEGEELLFVLEGKTELVYNGKSYILEEGDCCYFDSSKPHIGRSVSERPSKALVVFAVKSKR
jgi:transcriptional regulator with XRE-family HTH domain